MIVTILPGSGDFHAIRYNEKKISKGQARLMEKENIYLTDDCTTEDLVGFFKTYSEQNSRIKKAQFHVAVSCKGREMTPEQLLNFARLWLKEMGYAEPGQPLLIYSHDDTDNNHIHIVTSRVAPDGRKIDNNHERRRSQQVINRLLKNNPEEKADNDIRAAKAYTFGSFAQFKAILSSMGYQVYEKEGTVSVKRGGKVIRHFPLLEIAQLYNRKSQTDRKRNAQLRGILLKYRDVNINKEELKRELKEKFGLDLVFFGRKDKPYGYMIVDHKNRSVVNGAKVLSTEEVLDFATPEERFRRTEFFIDNLFTLNPKVTQHEINKRIRKQHAWLKDYVLHYKGQSYVLKPYMRDALDRNQRIAIVELYKPRTEAERDILCERLKISQKDLVSLSDTKPKNYADVLNDIREMFGSKEPLRMDGRCILGGISFTRHEDVTYAIDMNRNVIVNLNEEGFDVNRLIWPGQKQEKKREPVMRIKRYKLNDAGGGSQSENREWEVGQKNKQEDEMSRGRGMKM